MNTRKPLSRPALTAVACEPGKRALLKGQREIVIQHGDKFYRLRHTSNDKLILTK